MPESDEGHTVGEQQNDASKVTTTLPLFNIRKTDDSRCGAFAAPTEQEALETAADLWCVDTDDVEVFEV